jgi:hypothetical protein
MTGFHSRSRVPRSVPRSAGAEARLIGRPDCLPSPPSHLELICFSVNVCQRNSARQRPAVAREPPLSASVRAEPAPPQPRTAGQVARGVLRLGRADLPGLRAGPQIREIAGAARRQAHPRTSRTDSTPRVRGGCVGESWIRALSGIPHRSSTTQLPIRSAVTAVHAAGVWRGPGDHQRNHPRSWRGLLARRSRRAARPLLRSRHLACAEGGCTAHVAIRSPRWPAFCRMMEVVRTEDGR